MEVCGNAVCPVLHVRLSSPSDSRDVDKQLLENIAKECMANGVAVVTAKYLAEEIHCPPPRYNNNSLSLTLPFIKYFLSLLCSLRLTVNRLHTDEELDKAAKVIREACAKFIS